MSEPETVDAYIADADEAARPTLEELREVVISAVPEAEEGISYNVPFYRFHGTHVGITAFTNHATFGIGADAFGSDDRERFEAMGYATGKKTIQIGYEQDAPIAELTDLLAAKAEAARNAE